MQVVTLDGQERLWYKAPKAIHIALLRGTTADTDGNISMEQEPVFLDQLHQAMAAYNSGGRVVVQVLRVVAAGSIPSRMVHIPGVLVDKVRRRLYNTYITTPLVHNSYALFHAIHACASSRVADSYCIK